MKCGLLAFEGPSLLGMMSLDSGGQLHPKIIITPSTIQQEKPATVLLSEAAADDVEATVEAVAAVVSLKRDQQSPCSVESQDLIPPPSADLVVPSTDGKVKFVSCNIINLILSSLPCF